MKRKCGCVIQGDIRRGTNLVLREMQKHFDVVVLSTWTSEKDKIPKGTFKVVFNEKPQNLGVTNRNLQRVSSDAGLRYLEELGCTHVLKWRTDMLPTSLDLNKLLEWSAFHVPEGCSSRLVTCAFRNLTVREDYFSSIPDLFAFADIQTMKLLWGADGFNFSEKMNVPKDMVEEYGDQWIGKEDAGAIYCAETELYANFKSRLQAKTRRKLDHTSIAKEFMYLINHRKLKICWFGSENQFRSIKTALCFPWWTEKTWNNGRPTVYEKGYPIKKLREKLGLILTPYYTFIEAQYQKIWFSAYKRQNDIDAL